jgi:Flp pilus assembly protein TadG
MLSFRRSRKVTKAAFRQFRNDENGTAAIEFAYVALPFFTVLFAIIEMAMFFLADQTFENAAQDSSRLIMTGQAQMSKMTSDQFKTSVCSRLVALFDCPSGISIDVRNYQSFADVKLDDPIGADGKLRTDFVYQPGNQTDVVVVRVFYHWPLVIPALDANFASPKWGNERLMTATSIFRNEPFGTVAASPSGS